MNQKQIALSALMMLGIACAFTTATDAKEPGWPNIILLMGDDHGWEEVGYNGHPYVKTPFLDEMATNGLRLDITQPVYLRPVEMSSLAGTPIDTERSHPVIPFAPKSP